MSDQGAAKALHAATLDQEPEIVMAEALEQLGLSPDDLAVVAALVHRLSSAK
ncbi:MAG: hypothetical protein WD851_18605 [Pirellulales bacterium]